MKKLLGILKPLPLAILSLLIVTSFLRYYLYINSNQLIREFKNQNFREIYSLDTLKISSRLNSLSSVINWVCLEGSIADKAFYKMQRGQCTTGFFQQNQSISIPEASNILISFTIRLPKEVEYLFTIFLLFQILLIFALIYSTRKSEEDKRLNEIKVNKLARQVSHDIRSPLATLNTISNSINSLTSQEIALLKGAIDRINHISNSLLLNSRNKNIFIAPVPINEIVNVREVLASILHEKISEYSWQEKIQINYELAIAEAYTKLDEYEFKRIISNIINNSMEARISNNLLVITVSLEIISNSINIVIKDNGMGIHPSIISKIGEAEFTTKKEGNGLGLRHAFESIKNWDGVIELSSQIDQGTSIKIILPLAQTHKLTNILLDDDELVRLTWASSAKKHGQKLIAIATHQELQQLLPELSYSSNIYIDSSLGEGLAGEAIAQDLYSKGYNSLFITSGYDIEKFQHLTFLKGIRDKSPPWK